MRLVLGGGDRVHHPSLREGELDLAGVDARRPACEALVPQPAGQVARVPQRLQQVVCGGLVPGQHPLHLRVAEPVVAADGAAVGRRRTVGRHLDRDRVAVDARLQAAGVAGKRVRQHRLHPAGQIHGAAAPGRLLVDRPARDHERRHVGDVHEHPQAVLLPLDRDGVVEVARVRRVDREGEPAAQVGTGRVGRQRVGGQRRQLILHLLRPGRGHAL